MDEAPYKEREAMLAEDSTGIELELEECEKLIKSQLDQSCQDGLTRLEEQINAHKEAKNELDAEVK